MNKPRAISLFSGCGGDTLGLERAGFHVAAFNEFNAAAAHTHLTNFPNSVSLMEPNKKFTDITKVPDSVFEPYKDTIDLVFAGFPCQGFSKAGKKSANDPRNQMFRQFVRVVKAVKPKYMIGENVVGLLSMKSGPNDDDPLMLDVIKQAFDEIGYTLTHQVLEADEFGVPQSRKRLLIVGWNREKATPLPVESFWSAVTTWGASQTLPMMKSFVKPTLENALLLDPRAIPEDFASVAIPVSQDLEVTGTPHSYVVLKAQSFNETYQDKTYGRLLSCGKRESAIHSEIIDLTKPSKTIICTYDHQPRLLVGLLKPDGKAYARCLLPDELKQIQGFPADFILTGSEKEKIVQVGNAVPPALVEAVARQLISYLVVKKKKYIVKRKA
jgi:DNA (cytosine-5)-methyltransferase 1